MLKLKSNLVALTALIVLAAVLPAARALVFADDGSYDDDYRLSDPRVDRYLDVEITTNHGDGEYFEGDNVTLKFRVNQDAFVAIYSVDSRNRVNLIFPASPGDDNFVRGGVTYRIPDGYADYDLIVSGPEGVENMQIIASRDRFPIPDWYGASGLIDDWDDRFDFMDYLNSRYFMRYDGQRFAYDRTAIYINEWEPTYFSPVYYPDYPSWTVSGNAYLDYSWGSSVYVDGLYWGITPLYIPRIYVGWHTFSIYDPYGYYWESDFHITRYNTVIIDRNIIQPSQTTYSKYKDVRSLGYRDPVNNGYPKYNEKVRAMKKLSGGKAVSGKSIAYKAAASKNYVRGESRLVKSSKGYETTSISKSAMKSSRSKSNAYLRSAKMAASKSKVSKSTSGNSKRYSSGSSKKSSKSSSGYTTQRKSGSKSTSGSKYRKSTQTSRKGSGKSQKVTKRGKSKAAKSTGGKRSTMKRGSSGKSSGKSVRSTRAPSRSKSSGTSRTSKSGGKRP